MVEVKAAVEAVLFACDTPLSVERLHSLMPETKLSEIREAVEQLRSDYQQTGRAFLVEEVAEGYRLLTRPEHHELLSGLTKQRSDRKLSAAAMETLAIIAYKQPVKRVDLEAIRGVQSGELIRALMERGLVRIVGRENIPGAPLQYATTKEFMDAFGLRSLEDLPKPEEVK